MTMSTQNEWCILKIFPECNGLTDGLVKVWTCGDKYCPELEILAERNDTFFIYYADPSILEGPHFKFFVRNPTKRKELEEWVIEHNSDRGLKRIEIHSAMHNSTLQEGSQARRILELVRHMDKIRQIMELKKLGLR